MDEIRRLRKTSDETKDAAVSSTANSFSITMLWDLPTEVLDYILMKAVVKKVMDKKLAKSAWLGYASRVVQPMREVWSQWNHCLTTRWFKIMLTRILNNKEPTAISFTKVATRKYRSTRRRFAKLGGQIYLISDYPEGGGLHGNYCLRVFEVEDLINHTKSIPLPITEEPQGIAACHRSNSFYIWVNSDGDSDVWHLTSDGNGGFEVIRWPTYSLPSDLHLAGADTVSRVYYRIDSLSVLDDGNLLVKRRANVSLVESDSSSDSDTESDCEPETEVEVGSVLALQKPDGSSIQSVKLPVLSSSNVAMKSDGNFVYVQPCKDLVRELDPAGKEIHCYRFMDGCRRFLATFDVLFLDSYDRVILLDGQFHVTFLDPELNFLGAVYIDIPEFKPGCDFGCVLSAQFCKETNEMVIMCTDDIVVFVKLTF